MAVAGIDIGSRTIGLVVLDNRQVVQSVLTDTGYNPVQRAKDMILSLPPGTIITATGYGRHTAGENFAHSTVTEIKAHALGAAHFFPGARAVLDIGGQDMKVILLDSRGRVSDFVMNDKCAAGTGKFLEVMSAALGFQTVLEFASASLSGSAGIKISSMCTVFAESEAVSLMHRGAERNDIGRALHLAAADRALGLLQRAGCEAPLVFTGGVANNPCLVTMLKERLSGDVLLPPSPQLVGALGAALTANPR